MRGLKPGDKIEADYSFVGSFGQLITKPMRGIVIQSRNRLRLDCGHGEVIRLDKLDKGSIKLIEP